MKTAFLTETNFEGKWPLDFPNCRTEIAWQLTLDSYHYNIWNYNNVKGYDGVFVIIPKGDFYLNVVGCKLINNPNSISALLKSNFTDVLKENNKKIFFIQEGSTTLFNDMSVEDQFYYYNHLQNFNVLFAHNDYDCRYYRGMFPNKKISVIPTLMLTHLIKDVPWNPQNKVMIGGNMSRFYGGFQSYIVANEFENHKKWTMTSHSKREDEGFIEDLYHLPRLNWINWMKELSTFKYTIHMMPTYAAGTMSINSAFYGIPCISPVKLNTQFLCYPDLGIMCYDDIESARYIAKELYENKNFYNQISKQAKELAHRSWHIDQKKWLEHIEKVINE